MKSLFWSIWEHMTWPVVGGTLVFLVGFLNQLTSLVERVSKFLSVRRRKRSPEEVLADPEKAATDDLLNIKEEAKEILGDKTIGITDEQIAEIRKNGKLKEED